MESLKKFYFFVLTFLLLTSYGFSQGLNSVSTPDGIIVFAAGDNGLILKSTNAGDNWSEYNLGAESYKSVSTFGDDVWFAGTNGKVTKTLKNASPFSFFQAPTANTLNSINFINNSVGYVCGNGGVVYKTVNGGVNWTAANTGLPNVNWKSISFRDANNGIVAGDNGNVYITNNGGTSWTVQNTGLTRNLLKAKAFATGYVVSGEWGALAIYNGSAWSVVNTRTVSDIRGITGSSLTDIHICGGGGFIRNNTNNDARFYTFEINPMQANLVDIQYFNATIGFAVSSLNKAVIRTTNGGTAWTLTGGTTVSRTWQNKLTATSGIGNTLCRHSRNRDAMYVTYGSNIYVSWNRGDNWTQIASWGSLGSRAHSFYVNPLDTNIMMAAVVSTPDKIIRSTNHGQTWSTILSQNFSNYGQPLEQDQNNPNNYYFAPDNGGFWKSSNAGANFTEISGNYPFRSPCDVLVMWDSSNVIFVGDGVTGSGQAKIFRSSNGGVNWTDIRTVRASETPSLCNTVFDLNKIFATEWSGDSVYRSTNGGLSFQNIRGNGFSGWASDICHEDPNFVYIGNYGPASAFTLDNTVNWITGVTGMNNSGAGVMVPERGWIISQQTSNLYKMNITYTTPTVLLNIVEVLPGVPESFELSQNFPNPFNPETNIKFNIPVSGNVSLKVFDISGKEVSTLINEVKPAGYYEVTFNGSNLSSGVYFYRLESNSFNVTRKMLLVK